VEFLSALAPRVERIFVLFDYEEGRTAAYHPVLDSLGMLEREAEKRQFALERKEFDRPERDRAALEILRDEIFRERGRACPADGSLRMVIAATPAQEAEAIAREIRRLLRDGLNGVRVAPADIAILARNADAAYERLARTCRRFGVEVVEEPPALAHTPVGRAVLAALRLARDGWKREDLLSLLKSGFLPIEQATAFEIDLAARTRYLRERKSTWLERWPDEATAEALRIALAPPAAFDDAFHRNAGAEELLDALDALLDAFAANAVPAQPPLPDEQPAEAERYVALTASFTLAKAVLDDLRGLNKLLRGFQREELIELVTSALVRARLPVMGRGGGIPILSAHATGGQKFKVVFLCNLLQGVFPRHQRESSFLLDHEREEALPGLNIRIDARRHLEEDERFWFLHALSSATGRVVLSYPEHDANGAELERSYFIDEALKIVPELPAARTSFSDVAPPLWDAAHPAEWLARLAVELRTERAPDRQKELTAAYHANLPNYGQALAAFFQRAGRSEAALRAAEVLRRLAERSRPFSASELQGYLDCPFYWFASSCLGVEAVSEEYGMLDRGLVAHAALEQLYRRHQRRGEPVHLEGFTLEDLWPEVEADLREQVESEPRFINRPAFWKDIEWESLTRIMRRFLGREIERAAERATHPAYFERRFGSGGREPLELCGGALRLRGVIDRIDLADDDPDLAVVVDYKTSAVMTMKDLEAGKVLQAPIYALALARLLRFTPIGVEFMGIRQAEAKGIYQQEAKERYPDSRGMRFLTPDAWQSLLDNCEAALAAAAARMAAGEIPLAPTTPRCPLRCDYYPLCRGTRAELEGRVREAKVEKEAAV
jgi:ATP-dependent helicase/DNAse subunit B